MSARTFSALVAGLAVAAFIVGPMVWMAQTATDSSSSFAQNPAQPADPHAHSAPSAPRPQLADRLDILAREIDAMHRAISRMERAGSPESAMHEMRVILEALETARHVWQEHAPHAAPEPDAAEHRAQIQEKIERVIAMIEQKLAHAPRNESTTALRRALDETLVKWQQGQISPNEMLAALDAILHKVAAAFDADRAHNELQAAIDRLIDEIAKANARGDHQAAREMHEKLRQLLNKREESR